jgi:hypothetical protein
MNHGFTKNGYKRILFFSRISRLCCEVFRARRVMPISSTVGSPDPSPQLMTTVCVVQGLDPVATSCARPGEIAVDISSSSRAIRDLPSHHGAQPGGLTAGGGANW